MRRVPASEPNPKAHHLNDKKNPISEAGFSLGEVRSSVRLNVVVALTG